ncbi:MAG: hypothetical protein FWE91_08385 [Defluviitaleaceae bacterium]|nr:hypothetical protein [Defluviitaleaceae bacterium]MCL2835295.1 hypothetical protein [Defluviitaleaceae bacterium]
MQDKLTPFSELLRNMQTMPQTPYDIGELARRRIESINKSVGDLTGYDCLFCLNRGYIAILREDNHEVMQTCSCMETRKNLRQIERSGLSELMTRYTFDLYLTPNAWQRKIKEIARAFLAESIGKWF